MSNLGWIGLVWVYWVCFGFSLVNSYLRHFKLDFDAVKSNRLLVLGNLVNKMHFFWFNLDFLDPIAIIGK